MESEHPALLTVDEAAKLLRVHRETVLRYIRAQDLRAGFAGGGYRITVEAVEECMEVLARRRLEKD